LGGEGKEVGRVGSGYFSSFHWPQEVMGFINEIRDEVRYQGYEERDYFVKVRPEERNGEIRIRADVKEKTGGDGR
jgi:hypothetical protein